MPHVIRTSASRSFRGCRRRWDWAYRQHYVPLEEPKPLEFGRAFHAALEEVYEPSRWKSTTPRDKLELAIARLVKECEEHREKYLAETGTPRLDRDGQDDYDGRIELGREMLKHYVLEVHPVKDSWFKPVKVELEFEVPITDELGLDVLCYNSPACGQEHSNPDVVVHQGRVDAIVENLLNGGYYIVDWKTAAALRASEDLLWMDDQICRYCWALRFKLNLDIRGFLYVEILKNFPQAPRLLSRRYKGCLYSQDKHAPTEYNIYRETVSNGDIEAWDAGKYDDYLEFLLSEDAPKFYQRFRIEKTPAELGEIGRTVALEAQDMVQENLRIYPSTGRFSCPSCAYRSPCQMQMLGNDYRYTLDTIFGQAQ